MKILYVNPGKIDSGLDYVIKGPPLALLAIAAMVPEHEATLYDFKVETDSSTKFRNFLQQHDIIAITSMTPQIEHALEVAEMAKAEGKITILGGYHPTLEPDQVISNPNVDFVVRGEGEHTFRELIDYLDPEVPDSKKLKKEQITGISYRENSQVHHNTARALEADLDNFPIPRFELLNRNKYSYMGARVILMETSRGCPHNCKFCCIIKMWDDDSHKMRYRTKSLKRIMQEIYTIDLDFWDFIFFNDDNFTINIHRTEKILDMIKKSGVWRKIYFSCQSRVDTINKYPWLIEKMANAGMKQVFLGIESVHQQSLDAMNKKTNVQMIQRAVDLCHEYGISIFGGIIIGFPGETKEMVRENIDFAISLKLDFVQFTPITAFPGTDFFKELSEEGKIATHNFKFYNLFHAMLKTDELSQIEIYQLVAEAYAKYYMNPRYLGMMMRHAFLEKRYAWYRKIALPWLKQFLFGGWAMLHTQGISSEVIRADQSYKTRHNRWKSYMMTQKQRYHYFMTLIQQMKQKGTLQKSNVIWNYLVSRAIKI